MIEDVPLYDVKSKYYGASSAQNIVDQIIIDKITKNNSHTKMSGLESQINLETSEMSFFFNVLLYIKGTLILILV